MPKALIISGFPGIGKSHFKANQPGIVFDSDSSLFSWVNEGDDKVRNPEFPANYIAHIKWHSETADVILVSSHEEVRDALAKNNIDYTLVYPDVSLKEDYLDRYRKRGSDAAFIAFIGNHWEPFLSDIDKESHPKKITLQKGQYLSDIL